VTVAQTTPGPATPAWKRRAATARSGERLADWAAMPGQPGVYFQPYADGSGGVKRHRAPYAIKYRDTEGRQVGPIGYYLTVADAAGALATVVSRKAHGKKVIHSREPFAAFAAAWLRDAGDPSGENPLSARSVALYHQMLRLHVNPVIGRRPICEIDADDIKAVIAGMKQRNLSSGYIENAFKAMRGPLNRAVARHLLPHNPISLLERNERPKQTRKGYRVLAKTEVDALLAACEATPEKAKVWTALVGAGVFAGLRIGEVLGLTWGDIDVDRGIIRVERQYPQKLGHVPPSELPLPKHGRRRAVKLSARYARMLKELNLQAGRPDASTYLFMSDRGRVYTAEAVRKILAKLVAAAGITARVEGRLFDLAPKAEFTYHQLRHTFASALIHAGLSDFEVAVQLGHRDAATTRKFYIHLFNETETFDRAGAALDAAFGA